MSFKAQRQSATILPFPAGGKRQMRATDRDNPDRAERKGAPVIFDGAWYHQEEIQREEDRRGRH